MKKIHTEGLDKGKLMVLLKPLKGEDNDWRNFIGYLKTNACYGFKPHLDDSTIEVYRLYQFVNVANKNNGPIIS